jgi:hypothetical protein
MESLPKHLAKSFYILLNNKIKNLAITFSSETDFKR